jgi:uncharacterized damage-inducible protein DinB
MSSARVAAYDRVVRYAEEGGRPTQRAIEALLGLMDEAFRGPGIESSDESQALLPNLRTVPDEAWLEVPARGARSIAAIANHVAACKVMYDDYAFGSGTLRFATPEVEPWGEAANDRAAFMPWLLAAHARLVDHVRALAGDEELDRPRLTNWGEQRPTRWIIAALVTHDAYHAGEINHIRSLRSGDDRWRHVQLGFG